MHDQRQAENCDKFFASNRITFADVLLNQTSICPPRWYELNGCCLWGTLFSHMQLKCEKGFMRKCKANTEIHAKNYRKPAHQSNLLISKNHFAFRTRLYLWRWWISHLEAWKVTRLQNAQKLLRFSQEHMERKLTQPSLLFKTNPLSRAP